MTSPDIRAFLALEKTAQNALHGAFEPVGQKLVQLIARDPNSHAHVVSALSEFDHTGSMNAIRPKLKELAVSAILFGASRIKPTHQTTFMKALPHFILDNAVGQMVGIAGNNAKQKIDMDVRKLVANAPVKAVLKKSAMYACCPPAVERVCKAADDGGYPDLADAMNAVVMGTGRVLSDVAGNLTMSRLAAYGALSEAGASGMTRYQINSALDDKVCPVCMYMHGKTFDVETAKSRLQRSLSTDDPDTLAQTSPWPRQDKDSLADFLSSDAADLQARGYDCPPWHPNCRCLVVKDGDIDDTLPPLPKEPGNSVMQTISDMQHPADRPAKFKAPSSFFSWLQDLFESDGSDGTPATDEDDSEDDVE